MQETRGGYVTPFTSTEAFSMANFNSRIEEMNDGIDAVKDELSISPETAAQYGLGAGATPDDAFAWIGKYAEYWWSLLHGQASWYWTELLTPVTTNNVIAESTTTIQYSYSITISDSGVVSLNNPQTIYIPDDIKETALHQYCAQLVDLAANAPYYMSSTANRYPDAIFKIPKGATVSTTADISKTTFYSVSLSNRNYRIDLGIEGLVASVVSATVANVPEGETTYEHSPNRNAYPDSGTVGGVTYTYLGIPFEKMPTTPKIATGQYAGVGVYGENNKNSLTFEFTPKFVTIALSNKESYRLMWNFNITSSYLIGVNRAVQYSLNGKTLSWYSANSAVDQLNSSGVVYHYFAIGLG